MNKEEKQALGEVCKALRIALTGKPDGMPPWQIMEILGKESSLERIDRCIQTMNTNHGIMTPIGMSKWFNEKPNVVSGKWICPIDNCGGEMIYTGVEWTSSPPGCHHICDKCKFTAAIRDQRYPTVQRTKL